MRSEYPCMAGGLRNAEKLMCLQAESPARMCKAIRQRGARVRIPRGAVHGLEKEVPEVQALVSRRLGPLLWIDQLELVAAGHDQGCVGLGTHAQPVDARRRHHGAVALDGDL